MSLILLVKNKYSSKTVKSVQDNVFIESYVKTIPRVGPSSFQECDWTPVSHAERHLESIFEYFNRVIENELANCAELADFSVNSVF